MAPVIETSVANGLFVKCGQVRGPSARAQALAIRPPPDCGSKCQPHYKTNPLFFLTNDVESVAPMLSGPSETYLTSAIGEGEE